MKLGPICSAMTTEILSVAYQFQVKRRVYRFSQRIFALFFSHIYLFNFVLSQNRTKTEQCQNSEWNLVSLPENAQCLVQWFEKQWNGRDTLHSVVL